MPDYHSIVESGHELQNPTSPEKILLLGERLGLTPASRVLDLASGRGGPARLLAERFGCHLTCVESRVEFHDVARRRGHDEGLDSLIECVHADALASPIEPEAYDAALCLGASFIWDGLAGTLAALAPAVRSGGSVAVGEPYWRTFPPPAAVDDDWRDEFTSLEGTIGLFAKVGLEPVTFIDSSLDDWDRYESLHWLTGEAWLTEHGDEEGADEIREGIDEDRARYLAWQRELLGWAMIAGKKR